MNHRKLVSSSALILALIAASCGNKSVSDQTLTSNIQSQLYADSTTRQANVKVDVKDGAVTLSGEVPNSDVELQAMKIANGTAGVRSVSDQLKVTGTSAALNQPPATAMNSTDANTNPSQSTSAPVKPKASNLTSPSTPEPANPSRSEPSAENPGMASTEPPADSAPTQRSERERITIPAGERLSVRTTDAIDSGKASVGQTFRASLEAPIVSEGRVVIPAGAPVTLEIQSVQSAGRVKGNSELSVRATSVEYNGRKYPITSNVYADEGKARGKQTAVKTGVGAAAGAIIGAIAGGGKGAAIGSAAGGGAGFGWNALTHGEQVKIPSETVLSFRLESPLAITAHR